MKKETLYLDTSVVSAYCDDRTIERQQATVKFWEEVLPHYKIFISEVTVNELENTKEERMKEEFRRLIKGFNILKISREVRSLANVYIEKGIFPEKYIEDALHVAVATCNEMSFIVSWNYEHLVRVKTRKTVSLSNILEGYKEIEIISPQEL